MPTLEAVATLTPIAEPETLVVVDAVARPIATFDDVLTRYQSELYRFALHLTRHRADADDLYQETLLKAFRAFGRLDDAANHRAWLYRIATNTYLSDRRQQNRIASLDGQPGVVIRAKAVDHDARFDACALLNEVERYVMALPSKQRIALIMRKCHEMSYGDIADTLQCNEGAARANVHQALRKLRDHFADRLTP